MSSVKIDLSLDRIQCLLSVLPKYTRPTIHIAGTNGKGSVTTILESILLQAGFKTGKFNSPHLVHVRDSITLDGIPVSDEAYTRQFDEVNRYNEESGAGASSFELLTATAFRIFEVHSVDVAIVEVGMGGRLDATNTMPDDVVLIEGITGIDLDHQAFLGNTLPEIAREKAGIAKDGRLCVLGKVTGEVEEAVREAVVKAGGRVVLAGRVERREWEVEVDGPKPPTFSVHPLHPPPPQAIRVILPGKDPIKSLLSLQGEHQLANLATAVTIVDILRSHPSCTRQHASFNRISDEHISEGLRKTRWPGRLDWIPLRITPDSVSFSQGDDNGHQLALLVDGAHNPASSEALSHYITNLPLPSPRQFILSLSHSPPKTPLSTLAPLLRSGDRVVLVPFSPVEGMPWVKNVDQEALVAVVRELVGEGGEVAKFEELTDALRWAKERGQVGVLAGSLYLVADLYRSIGSYP